MKLTITLREVLESGKWDKFCEMKGLNPWCINEGLATGDEEYDLSPDECATLGIGISGSSNGANLPRSEAE